MKIKERGIIFKSEMVRAILDGRKTQTRRVIKNCTVGRDEISPFIKIGNFSGHYPDDLPEVIKNCCPFGKVGDRLWVRETFRVHSRATDVATLAYKASEQQSWTQQVARVPIELCTKQISPEAWTPSIHMPRWASRITLEITDIRLERLQEISQSDAQAEGMELTGWRPTYSDPDSGGDYQTPYDNFAELWESIYGEDSWQSNPFVWVIEFKKVES